MTDTELYEIVKDVPRELWPDGLTAEPWGNWEDEEDFEESWYWGIDIFFVKGAKRTKDSARMIATDHALLIWEGALSRVLSDLGGRESRDVPRGRWLAFTSGVSAPHADEIRLKALVAAVKELSK